MLHTQPPLHSRSWHIIQYWGWTLSYIHGVTFSGILNFVLALPRSFTDQRITGKQQRCRWLCDERNPIACQTELQMYTVHVHYTVSYTLFCIMNLFLGNVSEFLLHGSCMQCFKAQLNPVNGGLPTGASLVNIGGNQYSITDPLWSLVMRHWLSLPLTHMVHHPSSLPHCTSVLVPMEEAVHWKGFLHLMLKQ